jgi:hypothetical protein
VQSKWKSPESEVAHNSPFQLRSSHSGIINQASPVTAGALVDKLLCRIYRKSVSARTLLFKHVGFAITS